jgi:hypothetical protein
VSFERAFIIVIGSAIGFMMLRNGIKGISSGRVMFLMSSRVLDLGPFDRRLQPLRYWGTVICSLVTGSFMAAAMLDLLTDAGWMDLGEFRR